MQPTDWERIEELFHRARDIPLADRSAWLNSIAPDEPHIREEVESLLSADEPSTPITESIRSEFEKWPHRLFTENERFRNYRIVRKLDEGGMGVVYEAVRDDGAFDQRVAIKVLHAALATPALIQRFESERQILADLQHPNIAQLLDGGTTENGLPFLVMEFVEGESITSYCDRVGLQIPERLRLIQTLCSALEVAHRNLIVHRDIKPSNVLIRADGTLKLLDFGIAKVLSESTPVEATQAHTSLLTPEYASPEQILGTAISTATDIYSLGGLIYRLLTGASAFHELRTQPLALQKAVCETQPVRPSRRFVRRSGFTETVWPRRIRSELDAVILKAMRTEPEQRYGSVQALSEDIERLLSARPVLAKQGTQSYRAKKFMERNWVPLSATLAGLLLIAGLSVNYTIQLNKERKDALAALKEAQAARAKAELEQRTSEQVSNFMVTLFEGANTSKNRPDTRASEILDEGASRVENELSNTPEVQARLLFTIGNADWSMGRRALGEQRMREAIALADKNSNGKGVDLANFLASLSEEFVHVGRFDESEALTRRALAIFEDTLGPNSVRVADMIMDIDRIIGQRDHDNSDARVAASERARKIYEAAGLEQSDSYAALMVRQSDVHKQRFEWKDAVEKAWRTVELDRQNHGPDHYVTGMTYEEYARVRYYQGEYDEALKAFAKAIPRVEAFKGANSSEAGWSYYYSSRAFREKGQSSQAQARLEHLIQVETQSPSAIDKRYLARALCGLAIVRADQGDLKTARELAKRGSAMLQATNQRRVEMDVAYEAVGIVELASGNIPAGLKAMRALAAIRRLEHDPGQTDLPLAIAQQASAEWLAGDTETALRLLDEAEALSLKRYARDYPTRGRILWLRARIEQGLGDESKARASKKAAQDIFHRHGLVPQTAEWLIPPVNGGGESGPGPSGG